MILSLVLTKIDPLRITWYMPDAEDVDHVQIYLDRDKHLSGGNYQFDAPRDIAAAQDIHAKLMAERGEKTDGSSYVYVHYTLKNGREVIRYYKVDEHSAAYDALKAHFSSFRYLFNWDSWENLSNGALTQLTVNLYEDYEKTGEAATAGYVAPKAVELNAVHADDRAKIDQFLEALRKDCDAGNRAQSYTFHMGENSLGWSYLSTNILNEEGVITRNGERFRELTIYPCATHTLSVLDEWFTE